jgi:hypothetical protein
MLRDRGEPLVEEFEAVVVSLHDKRSPLKMWLPVLDCLCQRDQLALVHRQPGVCCMSGHHGPDEGNRAVTLLP